MAPKVSPQEKGLLPALRMDNRESEDTEYHMITKNRCAFLNI